MLRPYRADLHVHTCLSPCGELEMSPRKIVARARELGLGMIAVCDHNSAANTPAVTAAAGATGVVVLSGMEICSKEEIHLLGIFGNCEAALAMQAIVYDKLRGVNDPDAFGLQVIADADDTVAGFEERLLIGAVDMTAEEIAAEIHRQGGLAIAAHIDRESFSVTSQLGFVPPSLDVDAFELSPFIGDDEARGKFGEFVGRAYIRNSDAHRLAELGRNICAYVLEAPTTAELRRALRQEEGRSVMRS